MSQPDDPLNPYYELLKPHASQGFAALETLVTQFVNRGLLTGAEAFQLVQRFAPATATTTSSAVTGASELKLPADAPSLLVDWGNPPRIGHRARPTCLILCPGRRGKPLVEVQIDKQLDCDDSHGHRFFPEIDARGSERFDFNLSLCFATNGEDCRPGHYFIGVHIGWPDAPQGQAHYYKGRLRIAVEDSRKGQTRVLRISGDDQSLVNLQGVNLDRFDKVEFNASGAGVVNVLQSLASSQPPAVSPPAASSVSPCVTPMSLWPDEERQKLVPRVTRTPAAFPPAAAPSPLAPSDKPLTAACLVFRDGRRIGVLAQDHVSFGRNRRHDWNIKPPAGGNQASGDASRNATSDASNNATKDATNDVCLRFLPPSPENDRLSSRLSRRHFELALRDRQLHWSDRSSGGLEWDGKRIDRCLSLAPPVFTSTAGFQQHELACRLHGSPPSDGLRLRVTLCGRPELMTDAIESCWSELRDSMYAWKMGGDLSELCDLWKFGRETGLDAIRLERLNNGDQESYLLMVRQADLGGPAPAIRLDTTRHSPLAARLLHCHGGLWLETLSGSSQVEGQPLPPRAIVPLRAGLTCRIAGYEMFVNFWGQPEEMS